MHKVPSERFNIGHSLAERRECEAQGIQPIVQVWAKSSLFYQRLKLQITCGDDPRLHRNCPIRSDRLKFALFNYTQQFDLLIGGQNINFVQQDRAIACCKKLAILVGMRAR